MKKIYLIFIYSLIKLKFNIFIITKKCLFLKHINGQKY